ncbi:MAG: hypothetical protein RR123_01990 [Clostridia bacterium]
MFAVLLKNLLSPIDSGVSSGLNADALDYHQCKYGERADNMISIYSWLLNPVTMILGYVAPFLLSRIGFTSDWDVLYNQKIIADVFNIHIWLSFGSILATMVPFIFYDLTREKHDECIKKMQDDLRAATGETIDGDTRGDNTEGGSNEGGANPSETVVTAYQQTNFAEADINAQNLNDSEAQQSDELIKNQNGAEITEGI